MPTALEITRVRGGTGVDPSSKGWSPTGNPDEWRLTVRLSDSPNRSWRAAWEGVTGSLQPGLPELDRALWTFRPDEQEIELWTAEESAETVLHQLDEALRRANTRCAEIVAESVLRQGRLGQRSAEERAEAERLQTKLDSL